MRFVFLEKPDPAELRRRTAGWRQVSVWLPVAIMIMVICFESTGTFSAENTSGWIRPWMERIFGHINDTVWGWGHYLARKSGHLTGYALLCFSFLRAYLLTLGRSDTIAGEQWCLRSASLAILSTFTIASLDEWHQTFIPSRTGLFSDVLIDTTGGTILCCLIWLFFWRGGRWRAPSLRNPMVDDKPVEHGAPIS